QTPPTTEASLSGDQAGDVFTGDVTVALDADDATSGVAETHYRMAGDGEFTVYDEPFTVDDAGTHTVEFRSVDLAGNVEDLQSVEFTIDLGPCPDPDPRQTVVIGESDSGVPNYALDDGCTINDLVNDDEAWPNHGAFMRHVRDITDRLRADGVITGRESGQITQAAARSNVG